MAYVVTKFSKYHSNVLGDSTESSHPDFIILPSGKKVLVDDETRIHALWQNADNGKMIHLHQEISFKVLSQFDNVCDRNGSTIRWKVPKGSRLIWEKWDYEKERYTEDIEREIIV